MPSLDSAISDPGVVLGTRRFPDQCFAALYRSGGVGDEDHDVDIFFGRKMRDGGTADMGDADVGGIGGGEVGADLVGEEGEVGRPGCVGTKDLNWLRRHVWWGLEELACDSIRGFGSLSRLRATLGLC